MASGRLAAARLPKITSSRMSSTGSEMASARPMSALTSLLIAAYVGTCPPTWLASPGAASLPWMVAYVFSRAESDPPASCRAT